MCARHRTLEKRDWGGSGMQSEEGYDGRLFASPSRVSIWNSYQHFGSWTRPIKSIKDILRPNLLEAY